MSRIFIALCALLTIAACTDKSREMPVTELPQRPASAELPCEYLTDAEIIACIRQEDTREACRKVETNCARYENLKDFVRRTWAARDKK